MSGSLVGAGLAKHLPAPPPGYSWSMDLGSTTDSKGVVYDKVYMALLKGEDVVRRHVIDVGMYGYAGAIDWARNALAGLA